MLLPLVTKRPESKCRFFRLPENSASRGQGESARSVAGDKHDNGRTSSDRVGDEGGLGRIVGDATHLRGFAARGVFVRCVCGRSIQEVHQSDQGCVQEFVQDWPRQSEESRVACVRESVPRSLSNIRFLEV